MNRLSDIARITKCVLGILMIVSFFFPWVALTPSCIDKTVILRDNISGLALAREGMVTEAALVPLLGMIVAAAAILINGKRLPLVRSIVSLLEIPVVVYLFFYVYIALELFTPFIIRYGFVATEALFCGVLTVSLGEVAIHFGRLKRIGKVIVAIVMAAYITITLIECFLIYLE